ncbi:hypothetical protein AYO22_01331 [Fonsecaea multimorphosa]|nr:hypothetical protein AYO22_01331 [Fonsecaea multimorphosa]
MATDAPSKDGDNITAEEAVENGLMIPVTGTGTGTGKKPRVGARGQRKVKSGCRTCNTGRKCDFLLPATPPPSSSSSTSSSLQIAAAPRSESWAEAAAGRVHQSITTVSVSWQWQIQPPSTLPSHMRDMGDCEATNFEYFRSVCARDFALYFESPLWEALVLRYALAEESIFHAALAISSMSRNSYCPTASSSSSWYDPGHTSSSAAASEYCLAQYTLAIRRLNARLHLHPRCVASIELAAFASILFIYIEGMQGFTKSMHVHLRGGLALVRSLDHQQRLSPTCDVGYLEWALWQVREQVEEIEAVGRNS